MFFAGLYIDKNEVYAVALRIDRTAADNNRCVMILLIFIPIALKDNLKYTVRFRLVSHTLTQLTSFLRFLF